MHFIQGGVVGGLQVCVCFTPSRCRHLTWTDWTTRGKKKPKPHKPHFYISSLCNLMTSATFGKQQTHWVLSKMATNTTRGPNHRYQSCTYDEHPNLYWNHWQHVPHTQSILHWEEGFYHCSAYVSHHGLFRSLPGLQFCLKMTPGLCWGCKQVMGALVEWMYSSTGNQRKLIMCATPGWWRSRIWTGAAQPSVQM